MITENDLRKLGWLDWTAGTVGCFTLPTCFGGKTPFDAGQRVPCAIISSMCSKSPYERYCEGKKEDRQEGGQTCVGFAWEDPECDPIAAIRQLQEVIDAQLVKGLTE